MSQPPDPLAGAKGGAEEVLRELLAKMRTAQGVHVESLLCALGALGGYACQANLRAQAELRGLNSTALFNVVTGSDGKHYFSGDALDSMLVEYRFSLWNLAADAARKAGAKRLPDLKVVLGNSAAALGTDRFGILRMPPGLKPEDLPVNYVKSFWAALLPIVRKHAEQPLLWPILFGFAIQSAIEMTKAAISPEIAVVIIMESAVPMSRADLGDL